MSVKLTADNGRATLASIKRHINDERGKISPEMKRFLIDLAERAYEIMEVANPRSCAASFVTGTINNAQRR